MKADEDAQLCDSAIVLLSSDGVKFIYSGLLVKSTSDNDSRIKLDFTLQWALPEGVEFNKTDDEFKAQGERILREFAEKMIEECAFEAKRALN